MALMVACISPALQNLTETVKTLRYAQSAKKIKNKPVINLDPREEMLYMLKREIQSLKKENSLIKNAIASDPRYEELLNFIMQGKHLVDLPEISRGPSGKANILYKDMSKENGSAEDDYDKRLTSSAGINRSSAASSSFHKGGSEQSAGLDRSFRAPSHPSALEKYRQNRKFTPGLVEKEVSNTWRNARSISRTPSRGRQASRTASSRDRSASASTRASAVSRSSVVSRTDSFERSSKSSFSRADSIQKPSIGPKKSSMKRELSGRFNYSTVPDLKLNNRKNSDSIKDSKAPKEQSTSMSPQPDDTEHQLSPKPKLSYVSSPSENTSNDEASMKQRKASELSNAPEAITDKKSSKRSKETKSEKVSKYSPVENDFYNDEIVNLKEHKDLEESQKVKSDEAKEEKKSRSKDKDPKERKSTSKNTSEDKSKTKIEFKDQEMNNEPKKKLKSPDGDIEPNETSGRYKISDDTKSKKEKTSEEPKIRKKEDIPANDKKKGEKSKKHLVRKESEIAETESDDHHRLPDIIKLKKKTIKDVIALDEEISRMS
jgi:hypothetical protein